MKISMKELAAMYRMGIIVSHCNGDIGTHFNTLKDLTNKVKNYQICYDWTHEEAMDFINLWSYDKASNCWLLEGELFPHIP